MYSHSLTTCDAFAANELRNIATLISNLLTSKSCGNFKTFLVVFVIFHVFRAVFIAKLSYASSFWLGLTTVKVRQRLAAFIRRSIHQGYCVSGLAECRHHSRSGRYCFFQQALSCRDHVLATLLSDKLLRITTSNSGATKGSLFLKLN